MLSNDNICSPMTIMSAFIRSFKPCLPAVRHRLIFGIPVVAGRSETHPGCRGKIKTTKVQIFKILLIWWVQSAKQHWFQKSKGMLDVLEEVDKDFELVKVSFQRWAGPNMTESCVSSLKKSAKDFNSRFSQAPAAVGPQPWGTWCVPCQGLLLLLWSCTF